MNLLFISIQDNPRISVYNIFFSFICLVLLIVILFMLLYLRKTKMTHNIQMMQLHIDTQVAQEKLLKQQQLIERNRISQEMHDDLGSSLTTMFMGLELLQSKPNDPQYLKLVQDSTHKLSSQINDVIWNLNAQNDYLFSLLDQIERFATQFLSNASILLKFCTHSIVTDTQISGTLRRSIYLAIKELLNNIVKYSSAQNVTIEVEFDNLNLVIKVKDDGIGIVNHRQLHIHKKKTSGNGLRNIQKNIEEIKGTVVWNENMGTETIIYLPIN